ncbi:GD13122 [Drosophila simulans]|uniref:GD13122 n=1 Tax=Drosophila simulans TaxID=7240 RepID=B4QJF2_DROSI|nr:GD13122 [Drosophila simulans]
MNTSGDKLEPVVLGNVVALQVVDLVSRSTRTCFRPAALSPRAFSRVLSSAKAACPRQETINYSGYPWKVDLRVRHILHVKIGSGQSHSLCYGGTMGNGYFRTSQTSSSSRQREKR